MLFPKLLTLLLFHISNVGVPLLLLLLLPLLLLLTNVGIPLADVDLTILFVAVVASSGVVAILAGVVVGFLSFFCFLPRFASFSNVLKNAPARKTKKKAFDKKMCRYEKGKGHCFEQTLNDKIDVKSVRQCVGGWLRVGACG